MYYTIIHIILLEWIKDVLMYFCCLMGTKSQSLSHVLGGNNNPMDAGSTNASLEAAWDEIREILGI